MKYCKGSSTISGNYEPYAIISVNKWLNFQFISPPYSDANLRINHLVCDAPKRAELLKMNGHAGYYSCLYCEERGSQLVVKGRKTKVHFPPRIAPGARIYHADLRSTEKVKQLIERPDFDELDVEDVKGVTGKTLLAQYPVNQIDFMRNTHAEYMHLFCLGVAKDVLQRMYRKPKHMYFSYLSDG